MRKPKDCGPTVPQPGLFPLWGTSTIRVKFQVATMKGPKLIELCRFLHGDFCSGFGTVFQGVRRFLSLARAC